MHAPFYVASYQAAQPQHACPTTDY